MRIPHYCFWAVAIVCVATGCSTTVGSGKIVTETRAVKGFNAISVAGDADIEINQNGNEALTVTADDNILPLLQTEVRDGRLQLGARNMMNFQTSQKIRYVLSVKGLTDLSLLGDVNAHLKGIQTDRLSIDMSGDSDVTADGVTDQQKITILGDGKYEGQGLSSKTANVSVTGDGHIKLSVSDKLDVRIIGDGSIEYSGDPAVTKSVLGDGKIEKSH